jgi:hypothetical protein
MRKVVGGRGRGFLETGARSLTHLSSLFLCSSPSTPRVHDRGGGCGKERERDRGGGGADEVGFLQFILPFLMFSPPFF